MNGLAGLRAPARSATGRGTIPSVWRGQIVEAYGDGTVAALIPALLADQAVRMPCAIIEPTPGDLVIIGAVEGRSGDFVVIGSETAALAAASVAYVDEQVGARAAAVHTHTTADISNSTTLGRSLMSITDAVAARTAIGAGTSSLALGVTASTAKAGNYAPDWSEVTGKPATFAPSTHTHTTADVSDSTTLGKTLMKVADAAAARTAIGAGTSSLVIGTGSTNAMAGNRSFNYSEIVGTVPTAALPPLAVVETFVPNNQAEMLALTAQRGDIAIRLDTSKTYVLSSDSPGTLAAWKELLAAGQVTSVAGKSGVVSLVKGDVGLGSVDNTSDAAKPISTATQAALDAKAGTADVRAQSIAFKEQTDTPSTYPAGYSYFTAGSGQGWTGGLATITTLRAATARTVQWMVGKNTGDQWIRAEADATDTWGAWAKTSVDGHTHAYSALTGIPATFAPSAHPHSGADITSGTISPARIANATAALDGLLSMADKAKLDAATSSSSAAGNENKLLSRDASGYFGVPTPTATSHPARKDYVDGKKWDGADITSGTISDARIANATAALDGLLNKADKAKLDGATYLATGSTLALRHSSGSIHVVTGTGSDDAASKGYVDAGDAAQYSLAPILLPQTAASHDLDTYTTAGYYHQNGNTGAGNANYPIAHAGELWVKTSPTLFTYQDYTTYASLGNRKFWRAKYSSNAWTAWAEVEKVGHGHALATASVDGFMPKADKVKLDAATTSPTVGTLALRNSAGRIQVAEPGTDTTAATPRSYVDGKVWDGSQITTGTISDARIANATAALDGLMPKADKAKLDGATGGATGSTLALRYADGRLGVSTPTGSGDAANKSYVDSNVSTRALTNHTHAASDITTAASAITFGTSAGLATVEGRNNGANNMVARLYDSQNAHEIGLARNSANTGSEFKAQCVYDATTTTAVNVAVTAGGRVLRSTSAARYKAAIEDLGDRDDALLSLTASTWFDMREAEGMAREIEMQNSGEPTTDEKGNNLSGAPEKLRRVPGMVAEEVLAAGLDEFVIYGNDGQIEGLMYDRLGVALIPAVGRLRKRVADAETRLADLEARLAELAGGN